MTALTAKHQGSNSNIDMRGVATRVTMIATDHDSDAPSRNACPTRTVRDVQSIAQGFINTTTPARPKPRGQPSVQRNVFVQEDQRQRNHPHRRGVGEDCRASGRHPGDRFMRQGEIARRVGTTPIANSAGMSARCGTRSLPRSARISAAVKPDSKARPSANHNGVLPRLKAILVSGHALLSRTTDTASWSKPAAGMTWCRPTRQHVRVSTRQPGAT